MKIGALNRNLITVYSLVILIACNLEGCLSQPGEVISQADKNSKDALLGSKTSSSFNYFDSKKKYSSTSAGLIGKANESSPDIRRVEYLEDEKPGRVKISGDSVTKLENHVENEIRSKTKKRSESWRSKSLIESAKRFPKITKNYDQKKDRSKMIPHSLSQGIDNDIQQVVNTMPPESDDEIIKNTGIDLGVSAIDQFRSDELSRYYDQAPDQKATSQIAQLGKDLQRDLEQSQPTFEDVNHEMRRLQINTIMERAKQAAKRKNYEYALFLAEQAMESSYRGHIAFSPEEESPQKLLKHLKSISPVPEETEITPVEHTKSKVQTNAGQSISNIQFSPSSIHPLKKRAAVKPQQARPRTEKSDSRNQELPLITPRNGGNPRQKSSIQQRNSGNQEFNKRPSGILLEPPSFEETPDAKTELAVPEKLQPQNSNSVPRLKLNPELEEIPDKIPAKKDKSGPGFTTQESESKVNESNSPGPKLMLPKLPSVPQDLTSQTGRSAAHQATVLNRSGENHKTQTAPVKFRSKNQEHFNSEKTPEVKQNNIGMKENSPELESALVLDEIEWDLEEKQHPQTESSWLGMSSILLVISGVIILLLLSIIVFLVRQNQSPS